MAGVRAHRRLRRAGDGGNRWFEEVRQGCWASAFAYKVETAPVRAAVIPNTLIPQKSSEPCRRTPAPWRQLPQVECGDRIVPIVRGTAW